MASPTQWTWVWANSRKWWRTGKPGVLQSMGLQRAGHDWATEQQQTFPIYLKRLINIKQRGSRVILEGTYLRLWDANVLPGLLRNFYLCHLFKMQILKRGWSNLEIDSSKLNRNPKYISINIHLDKWVLFVLSARKLILIQLLL